MLPSVGLRCRTATVRDAETTDRNREFYAFFSP